MHTFDELMTAIKESNRPYDVDKIKRAYDWANESHHGQMRKSGEPYIIHPIAVAVILIDLGMDTDTVCAGLLHDVVEDTDTSLDSLKKNFGEDVALLVDGVTKLTKLQFSTKEETQAENVRKMLLAMAKDIRVIIIKLADRLHNMRTAQYWKEEKRRDKSQETMEVYAPLAHRLGIRTIKEELEDLSINNLDPFGYAEIEEQLAFRADERQDFLESIKKKIEERFAKENINIAISGRVKSVYGIYRKMYMQGKDFDEIYDIYAVRIFVNNIFECYGVLGVVHDMFTPIPNRFKDYISNPKANGYQSLHTTVLDRAGIPFEIQIRTWDMHNMAEYGIAAHWKYKSGISGKDNMEERLAWIRQLLEAQQISGDSTDILQGIKSDIAPEEIFVFTPKGDVINLPSGSTVIDFAYAIHTAVGNRMVGAKVGGRMVPLDYKLDTGMICEIITSNAQGKGPSRDWLNIVRTSSARTKIRAWFKKERREENIAQGREEVERELRRNLINLPDKELDNFILGQAKRQRMNSADEFYAAVGYGGVQLSRLMSRIRDDFQKQYRSEEEEKNEQQKALQQAQEQAKAQAAKKKKPTSGVIVEGEENCLVKFAKCCNPLPGDEIIGFVTRGYGVSIHKKDCVNVKNKEADPSRWVEAHWAESVHEKFKSDLEIIAQQREDLLADVSILLSNLHIPLHALSAREIPEGNSLIQINVEVKDVAQLQHLIGSLSNLRGVNKVHRVSAQ